MSAAKKIAQTVSVYASLIRRGPREFVDRLRVLGEIHADRRHRPQTVYQARRWDSALKVIDRYLPEIAEYAADPRLAAFEDEQRREIERFTPTAPFMHQLNADIVLARACCLVCRVLKPRVVVETGVGYGVTSSFLLHALHNNGYGQLHSVDLPPVWPGANRLVGVLVPERLRTRWQLHKGPSRRLLPALLAQVGRVDLFIHDSLHTYHNMLWELSIVTPYLADRAAVIVDDANENAAFAAWVTLTDPDCWMAIQQAEKRNLFGLALLVAAKTGVVARSAEPDCGWEATCYPEPIGRGM